MVSIASVPQSPDETRFRMYRLSDLLPACCWMTVDEELRVVSLLCSGEEGVQITQQQQFTDQEYDLLCLMLDGYPDYVPLADALSCLTGRNLGACRKEVNQALDEGYIEEVIRPVRNLMSRIRIKFRRFGLDIKSIIGTGYIVMPDRSRR